jgi:hypothetical protein
MALDDGQGSSYRDRLEGDERDDEDDADRQPAKSRVKEPAASRRAVRRDV